MRLTNWDRMSEARADISKATILPSMLRLLKSDGRPDLTQAGGMSSTRCFASESRLPLQLPKDMRCRSLPIS